MTRGRPRRRGPRRGRPSIVTTGLVGSLLLAGIVGCDGSSHSPTEPADQCGPFPDWSTSEYVLPYPVGAGYVVNQGNCSGFGHSGFWRHGYDFEMPIGAVVAASRGGVVLYSQDDGRDGVFSRTNLVAIGHADGTVAFYSHLTEGGALVEVGELVLQGQRIGLSGNSGNTGGLPHLHFSVHPCDGVPGLPGSGRCETLPVTFRNTTPNPSGLLAGEIYVAEVY